MRWEVLVAFVVLLGSGARPTATAQDSAPSDESSILSSPAAATLPGSRGDVAARVEELIQQLGDDAFTDREAASRELAAYGHRVREALERAAKSPDAEIAARASALLDRLPKLTHTIVDALGQPIPLAHVAIEFSRTEPRDDELSAPVTCTSEEDGRIAVPDFPAGGVTATVTVTHAEYGIARMSFDARDTTTLPLPLVRHGTEAHRRAVTGQVVSEDGTPVSGAVIHCFDVRTPGEGLIEAVALRGQALSDKDGWFTYYLPASDIRRAERGILIPSNSRYRLQITVPSDESFFPWVGRYANASPVRIELPHSTRFHRFRFEAAGGGWIGDPQELRQVRVQFERMQDGERILIGLAPESIIAGCNLLPGKYMAESFSGGKRVEYVPLLVTDESPDELEFVLPDAVTYRGRVVHAITGEPAAEAVVFGWNSTSYNNLAALGVDDWRLLQDSPSNPPSDHPAMQRLREFYGVQRLVRTDRDGRFEITREPDEEFYGILAFDAESIPFKVRVVALKPDDKNEIDVGEFPLFPAARIVVRPVFAGERLAVSPRWLPAEGEQPDWFERFQAAGRSSDREFEYVHWLVLNELQPVFVPAGVWLKVQFDTPYDDKWGDALVDTTCLEAGAAREIGDLRFAENVPVSVRVLDSQARPLEGVPVRQKHADDNAWSVAHNTDADGIAHFYAARNSEGQFWVSDLPGTRKARLAANLFANYRVDEGPPAHPFHITLTDKQAELLLGAGSKP